MSAPGGGREGVTNNANISFSFFHFHFEIIYTQSPFSLQILNKKVNSHIRYINMQLNLKLCTST